MSTKLGPDHYRFEDEIGPEGVTIHCRRYIVIGETPHCYYVIRESLAGYVGQTSDWAQQWLKKHRKRVLKQSDRRYCYPGLMDALRSYKARKAWQLKHAALAEARATAAHAEAARLIESDVLCVESFSDGHLCEGGEYIKGMNWEGC